MNNNKSINSAIYYFPTEMIVEIYNHCADTEKLVFKNVNNYFYNLIDNKIKNNKYNVLSFLKLLGKNNLVKYDDLQLELNYVFNIVHEPSSALKWSDKKYLINNNITLTNYSNTLYSHNINNNNLVGGATLKSKISEELFIPNNFKYLLLTTDLNIYLIEFSKQYETIECFSHYNHLFDITHTYFIKNNRAEYINNTEKLYNMNVTKVSTTEYNINVVDSIKQ